MEIKESSFAYQKTKKIYTYQDYLKLPDDRNRYEIIEGELIMGPAPSLNHQDVSRNLLIKIEAFLKKHNIGKIYHAPCDVVLSDYHVVQPDLIVVLDSNKNILSEKNIQGTPDLIIEILSPDTAYYDLVEKKELYEKFGVKEYWIVDPKKHRIEIFTLEEGNYLLFQRVEKEGKVKSKILDFEVPLKHIFQE